MNLLVVLDSLGKFGEMDTAAASRIDDEAVPCRPGMEADIGQRSLRPAVVGPAEVAVVVLGHTNQPSHVDSSGSEITKVFG